VLNVVYKIIVYKRIEQEGLCVR